MSVITNATTSNNEIKVLYGSASLSQSGGGVIATPDFKPLMIFTFTETGLSDSGAYSTDTGPSISVRSSVTDVFSTFNGSTSSSKLIARHSYDEETGNVIYKPNPTSSNSTNKVVFRILGV